MTAVLNRRRVVWCLLVGLWAALLALPPAPAWAGETVSLTVLATTDVHGNVWPYDYLRARPAAGGLAKVATYVKRVRAHQPNTLLLDCGDTFQGTPLAYLNAEQETSEPNPILAAMNAMGYDAMAVGNHEFNFGLRTLWRLKEQAHFPILGANVVSTYHSPQRDFEPYLIRTVGGVRVAILGLVTPSIPRWEPPEHRVGYEFRDVVETARRIVPGLRRKADVVILIVHAGLGRDPVTGQARPALYPEEDRVWEIAEQVPGIDAILFGHTHQEVAGREVNGVLLVQAKNWGQSVAELDFELSRVDARSPWRVTKRTSRTVPMDDSVPPDPDILELTRAAHERTELYLNTVVATLDQTVSARTGRIEDNPLVELIQRAQLRYGQADVSLASLFSTNIQWAAGPVTIRDVYRLYFYENKLFTVEITGAQLKEALEYSVRSFNTYPWPAGSSPFADVPGYNYDMAAGVSYRIDLTKPPGQRIVDLRFQGAPLEPTRRLRLALNSYRWSGGGRYDMLRHAKIVRRAGKEVREVILDYLRTAEKKLDTRLEHNWEIIPAEARQALVEWVTAPPPTAPPPSSGRLIPAPLAAEPLPSSAVAILNDLFEGRRGWERRDTVISLLLLLLIVAYVAFRHRRWKKTLG